MSVLLLAFLLAFAAPDGAAASGADSTAVAAPQFAPSVEFLPGQVRHLRSDVLNEDRIVNVFLPDGYASGQMRYPVLVVLDGEGNGPLAAVVARYLSGRGRAPQLIVVAVVNVDRDRDFTMYPDAQIPTCGGAARFRRFLAEELLPFVDREYRTQPYRILFGHSLGGLFGVTTLFFDPEPFNAVLAASPTLYFDRGRTLREIAAVLPARHNMNRFLFVRVGDELSYAESLDFLTREIAGHPPKGLVVDSQGLPTEQHWAMPLHVLPDGLRSLYKDWALTRDTLESGYAAVAEHYQQLTERFGYQIPIPEAIMNELGYQAIRKDDLDEALRLLQSNAEAHPDSWNAWDSLGYAHLKRGETAQAVQFYQKSLALNPDNANAVRALRLLETGRSAP